MNFCEHCGSKVENGVLCNCPDAQANYTTAPPPPPRMATPPPPVRTAAPPPPMRTAAPPPPMRTAAPPPPTRTAAPPPLMRTDTPPPPVRTATPPPLNRPAAPHQAQAPIMPSKPLVPVCPNCYIQAPKGASNFCGTCGSAYQMMEAPRPILKICTGCGKEGPRNSGQFCGECGGAYQMMEAPSFENGGICPHCNFQVPIGSGDYCTHCGRAFYGGGAFKMPDNINLGAAGDMLGDIGGKLGMSVQRLILAAISLLGLLACFIPWFSANERGVTVSVNAFRAAMGLLGETESEINIVGIPVFIVFAILLVLCFLGNRAGTLDKLKLVFAGGGVLAFVFALITYFHLFRSEEFVEIAEWIGGSVSFGFYLAIIISLAVGAIPFVKQLEG